LGKRVGIRSVKAVYLGICYAIAAGKGEEQIKRNLIANEKLQINKPK